MQNNVAKKPIENTKKKPPKKHWFLRIFNVFLMLFISWFALVLCIVLISRESLVEMSSGFFDKSTLMGSKVLNYLIYKQYIVFPIIVVIGMVVKEFKVKVLPNRIYINLTMLLYVLGHLGIIFYLMYRPLFMAN